MEWKNRDYLKLTIIGALVIFALSTVAFVYSYARTMQPASAFAVTGEGKAVMVPDTAKFTFTVLTEGGNDPIKLQRDNTTKVNAIIKYLKEQGIEDKDIKTEGYYLNPQYSYMPCREGSTCPPPKIGSYSVSQTTSVKTKDFDKAGELLAGVVSKGANQVSGIELTVDDKTAIENEARMDAMKQATDKARSIAKSGGFRLGRLLSVDEYSPGSPIPMYEGGYGGGDTSAIKAITPAVDIQPGSQEVIINVTLRYEIR
jgi:hypothetical protein